MRPLRTPLILTITLLILTASLGSIPTFSAPSQNPEPRTQNPKLIESVRAGFGDTGAYLIGEWLPVRVTLTNPAGGGDRRVRVEVDSVRSAADGELGSYALEVDLPAQSRKAVTLYAYTGDYARELQVRLIEEGAAKESMTAYIQPFEERGNVIVAVASSDPSLLNILNGEMVGHREEPPDPNSGSPNPQTPGPARAQIVHITPEDIPELPQALNSLGVLVLDDLDTATLTIEQRRALGGWVAHGGMLIGLGRPTGNALAGVADLLPVDLGPTRSVSSLDSLGSLVATPITPTETVLAPAATLKTGADIQARSLASDGSAPLVAMRELGGGHVAYLALSPALPPLNIWQGTLPLLKRLVAEHPTRLSFNANVRSNIFSYNMYPGLYASYGGGLFDLPGLDLPSPLLVASFLLVYIVLVGPATLIVLRRMRRQEWAWATVPALALIFSIGAYVIGYGSKGGDNLALRADLVATSPGTDLASVTRFLGLFSPRRDTYTLELDGPALVTEWNTYGFGDRPENPVTVLGGDTTRIEGVTINTWSLRGFMAEGQAQTESPLKLELRLAADFIEGSVRNISNAPLDDVALIMGGEAQYLGTLGPGEERPTLLRVSSEAFNDTLFAKVLPPPSGLLSGTLGRYPSGTIGSTDEQRRYNRKWQALGLAVNNHVTFAPPTRMEVLALAWGEAPAGNFHAQGGSRQESVTLWTSRAYVGGDNAQGTSSLSAVPSSTYAPGNSPYWLAGDIQYIPGVTLQLAPYADIILRLPPGSKPNTLRAAYRLASPLQSKVNVLAYNPGTGAWTPIGELDGESANTSASSHLEIPTPALYTGPAGDLTVRLLPESANQTVSFVILEFGLNGEGANP